MNFILGLEKVANVLTAKTRKRIPDEKFALSGRRYPIENIAHARNARARVMQYGTPAEQKEVFAKTEAAYPELKKTATGPLGMPMPPKPPAMPMTPKPAPMPAFTPPPKSNWNPSMKQFPRQAPIESPASIASTTNSELRIRQ